MRGCRAGEEARSLRAPGSTGGRDLSVTASDTHFKALRRSEMVHFRGGLSEKCITVLRIPLILSSPILPLPRDTDAPAWPSAHPNRVTRRANALTPCTLGIRDLVSESPCRAKDGEMPCALLSKLGKKGAVGTPETQLPYPHLSSGGLPGRPRTIPRKAPEASPNNLELRR